MKRTVTVEFERITMTARGIAKTKLWCPLCQDEADFIDTAAAAELVKLMRLQEIEIDPGSFHFFQPDTSRGLVCLKSITDKNVPVIYPLL